MSKEKEHAEASSDTLSDSSKLVSENDSTERPSSFNSNEEASAASEESISEAEELKSPKGDAAPKRWIRLTIHWPVAAAIMLILVLVRQLPWTTFVYPEEVNNAWVLSLNHMTMHHAQCGRDFSFTFGPLGFCYPKAFIPQTYHLMILLWTVLATCHWFVCYRISRRLFNNPLWALLWYAALAVPLSVFADVFFLAPAALMIVCYFCLDARSRTPSLETWVTAAMLGLIAAVKFTFFISNVFVITFVAVDQIFRRRQFPILAAVALVVFLLSWIASGQHIWLLWQYIATSLEISRGHSEAMCLGEPQHLWLAGLFIVSCAIFLLLLSFRLYSTFRFWTIVPLMATAGLLFLTFKAAYVRQDWGHQVIAPSTFAYLLMLFLPVFFKHEGWRLVRQCSVALIVVATFTVIPLNLKVQWYAYPVFAVKTLVFDSVGNLRKIADFFYGDKQKSAQYAEFMESLRGEQKELLAKLKGSADCYPINCSVVIANGMDYNPRPVVQTYCSYTKLLARQNADHLVGEKAPTWLILESMEPPDNWYPTINDGLSWLGFLRYYEPYENNKDFLLLKRLADNESRKVETLEVSETTCNFKDTVEIAQSCDTDSSIVWAEIDVTSTPWGKAQNLFFRTFPPVLNVKLKDGTMKSFKAPSEILRCGFIISPFLAQTGDLRHLYTDAWRKEIDTHKVVSFSITDDYNSLLPDKPVYARDYKLRLYKLSVRQVADSVPAGRE